MTRLRKILSLVFLVAFVGLVIWLAYHETRIPQNQGEVLNRMIELQREGRYDKAVQVVQNWMKDSRRDISHDEFLYQQIAIVYLMKAYNRPSSRDESTRRAEENLQKTISLFNGQSLNGLSLEPFEIGRAYEFLGDISEKDKCRLYEKAHELFVRQLPLITGESYTAYGHTTLLEPVRNDVRNHLDAVTGKSSRAGCQSH